MGKKLAIGLAAVTALAYRKRLRDWHLHWGATPEEVDAALPGATTCSSEADVVSTRADHDRRGPPAGGLAGLVQMGSGRGGAYTYDWIENLFGLGMKERRRHYLEWQHVEVGDTPSVAPGKDPGPNAMRVRILEQESALVTASDDGTWVWAFVLEPDGAGTRLISRNRIKNGGSLGGRLALALMTPGSWVMERKMLNGIKQRSERLARDSAPAPAR